MRRGPSYGEPPKRPEIPEYPNGMCAPLAESVRSWIQPRKDRLETGEGAKTPCDAGLGDKVRDVPQGVNVPTSFRELFFSPQEGTRRLASIVRGR